MLGIIGNCWIHDYNELSIPIAGYLINFRFSIYFSVQNIIIIVTYTHFLPLAAGDLVTMTTTMKLVKDIKDVAASATGKVRK